MSVEVGYLFDEPLGVYARKSHDQLTRMVMDGFVKYEAAQLDIDFVETLGGEHGSVPPIDEFRIGSLVESEDSYFGYGLVTPRMDTSDEARGIWYKIQRDGPEPTVVDSRHIAFPHPATIDPEQGKREVQRLMYELDKDQLESTLRMLYKMTGRLRAERPSRMCETESPSGTWLKLISKEPVENDVLYAIKSHSLDHLSRLFPDVKQSAGAAEAETPAEDDERQHILEWTEFTEAAADLLGRETGRGLASINRQYEVGNKTYYLKLAAEDGHFRGVQLLCDNADAWTSQLIDLEDPDYERENLNMVSPLWDKAEILACLQQGEPIDDQAYEYYRQLGENSIKEALQASAPVININLAQQKRPAA